MSKVCQYLKLCPKQSHMLNYAHIYLPTIMLKILPA